MDNTQEFRCISLCSGYAGLELGLRRVIPNLRTVAYVEREGFACANLVAKIEAGRLDAAPIWTDVKTFPGQLFYKRVHIITGGYPCQPFSVAGKRQGTDDPRHLWPHIERIIQAVEPIWFFGENVSGHLSIGFPEVYRSLRLMGYKVEAGLFTAAECGAPHKRERLFILGKLVNSKSLCDSRISRNNNSSQKEDGARLQQLRGRSKLYQEMANTNRKRFQEQCRAKPICSSIPKSEYEDIYGWPSRPGQPQYEWEEPRVVANTKSRRPTRAVSKCNEAQDAGQGENERCNVIEPIASRTEGQAQSRLGRTAYGTQSRVDRLRLLGNGVVPQQAELAFRTLIKLFPVETKK